MVEPDRPHDDILWCMRFAFWIIKAIDTHPEYEYLSLSHGDNDYANAPLCYVYTYIACLVEC